MMEWNQSLHARTGLLKDEARWVGCRTDLWEVLRTRSEEWRVRKKLCRMAQSFLDHHTASSPSSCEASSLVLVPTRT